MTRARTGAATISGAKAAHAGGAPMTTSDQVTDQAPAPGGPAPEGGGPDAVDWRGVLSAVRRHYRGSAWQEFFHRLNELEFFDWIVIFGGAVLVSVLPFLILVGSLASHRVDTDIARHIGLDSQGAAVVAQLFFTKTTDHSTATLVTAFVLGLLGTMAVADSLQIIYEKIYGLTHRGIRDSLRFLVWVGVFFGAMVAEGFISPSVRNPVVQAVVAFVGITAFFWWTMHYLLHRRVGWRVLAAPAVVTALFWLGLAVFSDLYFSSTIVSDSRIYGTIGVVFSLMTWFVAIGAVIMLGALAGAVLHDRRHRSEGADPPVAPGG
ncbi:MAG TPA: YhjD/YihY/BrkB family envelope integrity protein [Acidimicrobiales bacterium]|nr:YhjD/YihY/BrkB family envelope integrity protein [Acidimicrobiales bacterium]